MVSAVYASLWVGKTEARQISMLRTLVTDLWEKHLRFCEIANLIEDASGRGV